jgi:FKBP-type peptidyl-prolyl cis-trans isomerase 2
MGMESGEKKTIEIEPSEAYGDLRDDLQQQVSTSQLPENVKVGDVLTAQTPQGDVNVTVKEINGDMATVDANHPLAGKKLIFDLEVVEVA